MDQFLEVLPPLWNGLGVTAQVFCWALVFSIPLGLIICSMRMSKIAPVR